MAHILIVDDEEQNLELLREILEEEGHEVIAASNGGEGINRYRQSPADLIITDLVMPEKDGLEMIRELRQEFPKSKFIAISGCTERICQNVLKCSKRFGASQTIMKPFDRTTFLAAVNNMLLK